MRFIHTADWHLGRLFHSLPSHRRPAVHPRRAFAAGRELAGRCPGHRRRRLRPGGAAAGCRASARQRHCLSGPRSGGRGGHDRGQPRQCARLEYLSELARRTGVHVVGRVGRRGSGRRRSRAATARRCASGRSPTPTPRAPATRLQRDDMHTHEEVVAAQLETIARGAGGAARDVVVGHAFVAGCRQCESERELTVGGSAAVSAGSVQRVRLCRPGPPARAGRRLDRSASATRGRCSSTPSARPTSRSRSPWSISEPGASSRSRRRSCPSGAMSAGSAAHSRSF